MDNQIRIALVGCNGRMGKVLVEAICNNPQARLTAALERSGSPVLGLDVGELNGLGALGVTITGKYGPAIWCARRDGDQRRLAILEAASRGLRT